MPETGREGSQDERRQKRNTLPGQGEIPPETANLVANVPDQKMYTWESQAAQYPPSGPPGISYVRGDLSDELHVDCLLFRDDTGKLVGILNHYPAGIPPLEREGDENVWVHPEHRRQGIGSALITESFFRWGPNPNAGDLRLTESGVRLVQGMEEKRSIVRLELSAQPGVVYDEWLNADGMCEWICPRPAVPTRIEIDPQVGGQYRIDIDDEGLALSVTGRYLVLNEPDGLVFTWHSTNWEPSAPESVVMVRLEPGDEGQTLMTLRHGRLPAELRANYEAGWARAAAQLEERLAGR